MKSTFTSLLMRWHMQSNNRAMPWKGEKDPYKIWLSEVILQQTRVEQGWAYYERFIEKYPTVEKLAKAKDEVVFKLWEGLGYYNRCRNLLLTARKIVAEFDGKFPENYDALLSLKGVGPYTAAAIASFAFGLPHAVVDGNVFRVLARVHDIDTPIDSTEGKQQFSALAEELLDKKEAGSYNQAIMDFGATVCKPLLPLCHDCPLKKICKAHHRGRASILPVKEKVLQKKKRWFYYFLLEVDGRILVRERTAKDIWQNLFEFYLLETPSEIEWDNQSMEEWLLQQFDMKPMKAPLVSEVYSQQLTHQLIKGQFIYVQLKKIPTNLEHATWQPNKKLNKLAFPKFIRQYLDTKYIQIGLF